jgi:hypothetical protein
MAIPKGLTVPEQVNESVFFSLDEFDQAVFDSLSDGYKKLIMASPEYQHAISKHQDTGGVTYLSDLDDSIPF